jgi:Zn-dependent protease with chaperone function
MRRVLKPLAIVLAVPVLATALGLLGRTDWDARWIATLTRQLAAQHMRPDARLLARYSLATLCADPRAGARLPPCRTYNLYSFVIRASAGAGGVGFLVLGGLAAAGYLCRDDRRRLIRWFRPSLVFAAGGTALLAVINAMLAFAAIVAGTTYLFGEPVERVSTSLGLVAGTGAVVWAIAMAVVAFGVTRRPTVAVVGRVTGPEGQGPLFDEIRRVAGAVGAKVPGNVVLCLAPWMFVSEVRVACLDGVVSGRTLCLSLSLGRILSVDEFRALLAHELAHFAGEDEGFARRVAPFHLGAREALDRLGRPSRGLRAAAVAPPRAVLSFFLDGIRADGDVGGGREIAADRAAAAVAGREVLGSALVKTHAFAPAWYAVAGAMQDAADAGTQYLNAAALFQEVVVANTSPERLRGIGQQGHVHPTDRHPMLAERLTALGLDLPHVALAALATAPVPSAASLVRGYEAIEERLSTAEHQVLVDTGGELNA